MKIMIINGPNLNMLGTREPDIYGRVSYADVVKGLRLHAAAIDVEVDFVQSNHEGVLVDAIQNAYFDGLDGIVINPGAYTHTSIALLDALKATALPAVEIHISDPDTREPFRAVSYIRDACIDTVKGEGTKGYAIALDRLVAYLKEHGHDA